MHRYFSAKRKTPDEENVSPSSNNNNKRVDLDKFPSDPSERIAIEAYDPNQKDEIRRAYLLRGLFQPTGHDFPQREISGRLRKFCTTWFKEYGNWLEYSIKLDRAFCLFCYLFNERGQADAFVKNGFNTWNKAKEAFTKHIGDVNSYHNRPRKKGADLLRQQQSIHAAFDKQTDKHKKKYRTRLSSSVYLAQALLNGGLPFCGHRESEDSPYR